MRIRSSKVWALALGLAMAPGARAAPPAIVQQEINYLLRYIGDSGCEFKRNGLWNDSETSEAHVRGKYDFLVTLGLIDVTEDFIARAATESSLSGQPYGIRCGRGLSMPSGLWLSNELARYRASKR